MRRPVPLLVGAVCFGVVFAAPLAAATTLSAARAVVHPATAATEPPGTPPRTLTGDAVAHDPSIAREAGRWYVLSTGDPAVAGGAIQLRSSRDGRHWRFRGPVSSGIPAWVTAAVPGVANLWAPDVSRHRGIWYLYYAASTFGSNRSVIGLMTTPTLDPSDPRYHWTDQGLVLESVTTDDFNAIDPALSLDAQGRPWLAFGSFWSGIQITAISLPSGKPASSRPAHTSLVDRHVPPNAVEAPYLVAHGGWYYLFASFDFCCQGVNSTYRVVVGRSRSITGPYVDRNGDSMEQGGGSPFLDGRGSMRGPGGESVSANTFAFHFYDAANGGKPHLGLAHLVWRGGWPELRRVRI
jgi:arabinan endo-1,5-alpha-L-arabinosidase